MRIDVYFHTVPDHAVLDRLDVISRKMDRIMQSQEIIMSIAQDLEDEVAQETTVIAGVETVVQNLIDAVKAAGADQTKLAAVLAAAQANKTRLGALVATNTPAPPADPPPPIVNTPQ